MHIALILNRDSGTLRGLDADQVAKDLVDILEGAGHQVSVSVLDCAKAIAAIERTCSENSVDALVIGGGDGTVSAAAAAAAKSGTTLGVLPLGTMNLFARSLGIPLDMKAAAEALANGAVVAVDIADVNGRYFVHHVTLGLHAKIIAARERFSYGSRFGKMWASCQAWWFVVRQPPGLQVRISAPGLKLERRTAAVLVSNNPLGDGHLPFADDPSRGMLGLYVVKSRGVSDLLKLSMRIVFGRLSASPQLDNWLVSEVDIALPGERVTASVDGEIVELSTPLRCRHHRGLLRVLRPRETLVAKDSFDIHEPELHSVPGVASMKQMQGSL